MSDIQDRIALEKAMRHQLNLLIGEMEQFVFIHGIETGDPSLEANDIDGAILSIPVAETVTQAAKYTDLFNLTYQYPNARIQFTGIYPIELQSDLQPG
jgi:hypothetical protein